MTKDSDDRASQRSTHSFPIHKLGYELPEDLIAQHPADKRDDSRLLVLDRGTGEVDDAAIKNIVDFLRPHDLLVLNDTKVIPAKFTARRRSGGMIRGLFERETAPRTWEVMLAPSRRLRIGEVLFLYHLADPCSQEHADRHIPMTLSKSLGEGRWMIKVGADETAQQILNRIGTTPLPPYIRRDNKDVNEDPSDRERYQTVYAKNPGAIAAPTAGLHLTKKLLETMEGKGVQIAFVTLHVGTGTFSPVRVDDLCQHVMHVERFDLPNSTASAVKRCRTKGGRIVAVGTTSVRVLESMADSSTPGQVRSGGGETDIFMYPPFRFCVVDALLTNFHLPKSTLLALVMAFGGVENMHKAYRHAIVQKYRFYSFGDAMLIQ